MKVLVCGKGGAGKSAVTVLLARRMRQEGPVYVLDADESNRLLSKTLGVEAPATIGDYLGGRNKLRAEIQEREKIRLEDLPADYVRKYDGLVFAVVGKIEEFGEGCACPYGFLSRELLKRVELGPSATLLVDAEAGVEHLGRGVEEGIDRIVVVVDPTAEGVAIAAMLRDEAARIGKPLHVVLNKVTDELEPVMHAKLEAEGLEAAAVVRMDLMIFRSSLEGTPLEAGDALEGVDALASILVGG